jgi:iron complex transport system permease protein
MDTVNFHDIRYLKRVVTGLLGLVILVLGFIASVKLGAVDISVGEIIALLRGDKNIANYHIIWNIRLPRIIAGALVGMNLAIAGAILQCIMRNPLADPGIIGVTSGAGLAAVVVMILFPEHNSLVPIVAFAGAILSSLVVYGISWKGVVNPLRLMLAGVAVA